MSIIRSSEESKLLLLKIYNSELELSRLAAKLRDHDTHGRGSIYRVTISAW